jgi:hypothetical protein
MRPGGVTDPRTISTRTSDTARSLDLHDCALIIRETRANRKPQAPVQTSNGFAIVEVRTRYPSASFLSIGSRYPADERDEWQLHWSVRGMTAARRDYADG